MDFSREMIVVAALGGRPSGGYGILVDSAVARGGDLFVRVRLTSPGARCGTTAALTAPVDMVRLPVRAADPFYADYGVSTDCP